MDVHNGQDPQLSAFGQLVAHKVLGPDSVGMGGVDSVLPKLGFDPELRYLVPQLKPHLVAKLTSQLQGQGSLLANSSSKNGPSWWGHVNCCGRIWRISRGAGTAFEFGAGTRGNALASWCQEDRGYRFAFCGERQTSDKVLMQQTHSVCGLRWGAPNDPMHRSNCPMPSVLPVISGHQPRTANVPGSRIRWSGVAGAVGSGDARVADGLRRHLTIRSLSLRAASRAGAKLARCCQS